MTEASERVRYQSLISDSARWDGFEFRDGDIVISTPAKCGTTWTQMICALLVFQTPELPLPLDELSPWLDMQTRTPQETEAIFEQQRHRRFIKTHTPFDGLPLDDRVRYICVGRDPRDVALSMLNHRANFDFAALLTAREHAVGLGDVTDQLAAGPPPEADTELGRFWDWIDYDITTRPPGSSLQMLVHHIATFWPSRNANTVHMIHYDDLKRDLEGEMRRLAAYLDIEVAQDIWPELVHAATFEQMKANADTTAPDVSHKVWQNNADFFRNGTSGQWKALLSDVDRQRYEHTARSLMSTDIFDWLHRDA